MEKIKNKIQERGLKIKWVAEQCGVSQQLMSMYLNETRNMPEAIEVKINELLF